MTASDTAAGLAAEQPAAPSQSSGVTRRAVLIGFAVFAILSLGNPQGLLNDADTLWHISVGQWILDHRAFPDKDLFSFTMAGQPWIAKEWLSQVILAVAAGVGGWTAVSLLTCVTVGASFGLLAWMLLRATGPVAAYLMLGGAYVLVLGHLLARPHVLAFPVMLVWFWGLSRASEDSRAPSLLLLPVMTVWANMHGAFTFGLTASAGFALDAVLRAAPEQRRGLALRWAAFIVAAFGFACLTPYGPQSLLMTRKIYGLGEALNFIIEWQPTNFRTEWPLGAVLMLYLLAALWFRVQLPPGRVLIVVGLSYMALQATRNLELFGFLTPIVVAGSLGLRPTGERRNFLPGVPDKALAAGMAAMAAVVVGVAALRHVAPPVGHQVTAALDHAVSAGYAQRPVFNDYGMGGEMIARRIPTFIDGRAELFGEAFVMDYVRTSLLSVKADPLAMLDRYKVEWTLLSPSAPMVHYLDQRPDWRRDYTDDVAVIHVRVKPPPG
ncbi:hypothetical protein NK718_05055 [Alsobacter sp. SYSU M60028]|uniref:Glycosyltransferase RgtA/B/C/D-like domain-containing protein n=1 Tax=Alsobacter ponti TaxID=2962936 RepID=A0ABT1L8P5_9HYPH|nr:hypothetical protein [Alsobacter ponti]MCP8937875.1 hypothetical protein [Alsobacter ponti]